MKNFLGISGAGMGRHDINNAGNAGGDGGDDGAIVARYSSIRN